MNYLNLAAVALLPATAAPALAAFFLTSGDTTGSPTYNRPNFGLPPTRLSGFATDVPYDTLSFSVTAAGSYDFLSNAVFDNYLGLYRGSFDPSDAPANAIIYNDDLPDPGISGFTTTLALGQTYIAVITGYRNVSFVAYDLSIDGPGNIVLSGAVPGVPEPASWALMIAGFGLVGGAMRARAAGVRYTLG